MSTDAAVVAEEVVDQTAQDDDAGFADGFNEARGVEPPAPEAPPAAPVEEPAPVVAETPPVDETVVLNQSEIKNLLSRLELLDKHQASLDKAHGRLGSLQETITKLQTAQASGDTVELTDEDVADLKDYPEFAGSMKTVLGKVLSRVRTSGAAPVDLDPVKQEFHAALAEAKKELTRESMSAIREDWEEVVAGEKFKLWLAAQPEESRNTINDSWSPKVVLKAIRQFETDTAKKAEAPPPTKTNSNKERLEAAVTPKGVRSPDTAALNEEDAFAAGFKSARGG